MPRLRDWWDAPPTGLVGCPAYGIGGMPRLRDWWDAPPTGLVGCPAYGIGVRDNGW